MYLLIISVDVLTDMNVMSYFAISYIKCNCQLYGIFILKHKNNTECKNDRHITKKKQQIKFNLSLQRNRQQIFKYHQYKSNIDDSKKRADSSLLKE